MTDPRVTVLLPSMGRYGSEAFAAILRGYGFNATAFRESDEAVLKMGRANTSCKECLPLILTTGTLLSYIRNGKRDDELLVYFFATGSGPCRFGQYYIFMEDLVNRLQIPDVAILALSSENSYVGMGEDFDRRGWWAVVVSDVIEDIRSMLLANATDTASAMTVFEEEWGKTRDLRDTILLDSFIIMPNHFHGLIIIGKDQENQATHRVAPTLKAGSSGAVIGQIKSKATKRIRAAGLPDFKWQRNYYEHIVRNDMEMGRIREYIIRNPVRWEFDRNNPQGRPDKQERYFWALHGVILDEV